MLSIIVNYYGSRLTSTSDSFTACAGWREVVTSRRNKHPVSQISSEICLPSCKNYANNAQNDVKMCGFFCVMPTDTFVVQVGVFGLEASFGSVIFCCQDYGTQHRWR